MRTPKIEKNIPFPDKVSVRDKHNHNTNAIVNVLLALDVGDSFVIGEAYRCTVYNRAYDNNIKITVRSRGGGSIRVWRIA